MRAIRLPLSLLATLFLSGCGGGSPCGGADYGTSNREYVGAYTGTYHNERNADPSDPVKDLTFQGTVDEGGRFTGTVTETNSGRTAGVTGSLIDWYEPCDEDLTFANLSFTFSAESERNLEASRKREPAQPWSFRSEYLEGGVSIGSGQLVLTKE